MRFVAFTWVVAAVAFAAGAHAATFGTRLTATADPARTVSITWHSDAPAPTGGAPDVDARFVYGETEAALVSAPVVAVAETHAFPGTLGRSFTVRLTGLEPARAYFYRVGDAAVVRSFRTLSDDPCDAVRFVVIGDNRTSNNDGSGVSVHYAGILDEAFAELPDFFVNTGDMVKHGEVESEWTDLVRTSEPSWSRTVTLPTVGNHDEDDVDGDGAHYNLLFDLPRNSATGTEDYYALDIGPIHIVSLSSQHTSSSEMSAMAAWLDADLAATTQPWKIVFFHKGMYSRGGHVTGASGAPLNRNLIGVLDTHHVDVVLNGHSHDYERFAPSRGADVAFGGTGRVFPIGGAAALVPGAPLPDGSVGTTYVLSGGGGASLTTPKLAIADCEAAGCTGCGSEAVACPDEVLTNDFRGAVAFSKRHNFVAIEIAGGRLRLQAVATATGNETAALLDELTIEKPSFVCVPRGAGVDGAPRVDVDGPLDGIGVMGERPRGAGDERGHEKAPPPLRAADGVQRATVPSDPRSCAASGGAMGCGLLALALRRVRRGHAPHLPR